MALPITHLASCAVGFAGGIAITFAVINVGGSGTEPGDVPTPPTVMRAQFEAAIAPDPWTGKFPQPRKRKRHSTGRKGETFPNVTITLGQCDQATIGPGVACMSRILRGPDGEPAAKRLVGFSKSPNGWVATLY